MPFADDRDESLCKARLRLYEGAIEALLIRYLLIDGMLFADDLDESLFKARHGIEEFVLSHHLAA